MSYGRNRVLNKKLPSFAGFFVLAAALGITLLLSGNAFIFVSRATIGSDPKNIQISNLTDSSFTISYTTDASSVGTISYGLDSSTPNIALDVRDQQVGSANSYQVHFITVNNLAPGTKYYYVIDSGSQKLENNGAPFEVTTDDQLINAPSGEPTLSGTVAQSDGSSPKEGIIYASTDNSQQLAALINADGTYQLSLNDMRDSTATEAAVLTPDTVLTLQAVSPAQSSTAKILENQAQQVPKIVLSQNYDFTLGSSQEASGSAQIASGSAAFPALATPVPVSSPEITSPTTDEALGDQRPLFEGLALPDQEVDITIHSTQEISTSIKSDDSGQWQFRPPQALAPGKHTITIKSVDASGILQTITRSFTVYAAGSKFIEPSVSPVASPSAIPTLPVQPTPTAAPTSTPSPTPTTGPTAAVTKQPTPIPSRAPIPKTGSSALVTGTIAAVITIGIGALLFFLSAI
ncbi:MAG TPA: Ig-like domain-containing protein [Candidatus Saccharimonadales bacterium]|nr:Ig-like domain-containing protein [Candidatus Saccharimonadales bacterium]